MLFSNNVLNRDEIPTAVRKQLALSLVASRFSHNAGTWPAIHDGLERKLRHLNAEVGSVLHGGARGQRALAGRQGFQQRGEYHQIFG